MWAGVLVVDDYGWAGPKCVSVDDPRTDVEGPRTDLARPGTAEMLGEADPYVAGETLVTAEGKIEYGAVWSDECSADGRTGSRVGARSYADAPGIK